MKSKRILTQGIVQGVGFRPFIYRLAHNLKLKGYVRNLGNVVEIILQGNDEKILEFLSEIKNNIPPIARIDTIESYDEEYETFDDFKILESENNYSGTSTIPADIAICDKCLEEIRNPDNRRYKYPFNACTDCGARFTVIESVPYDRDRTSMIDFPLCNECLEEYENPLDRRYHGEAICCKECGPSMKLYDKNKKKINVKNPIKKASELLKRGKIIAIKGIGGTHLVVDAKNEKAIKTLRKRLNRPNQPFAVISKDIGEIKKFSNLSKKEIKTLTSNKRPIVVVDKNEKYDFPEVLAPKLHNIGVMLPYSGMHYLLFDESEDINTFVMTSANIPGEPMMITNEEIMNLNNIVDYFLVHNRQIVNRCDDSVIRFRNNELAFIRRSRGYAPEPYKISETYKNELNNSNILALGPELDVTFAIRKEQLIYPSQHIGNTNKFKTLEFLKDAIKHMMRITKTDNFDIIAHDMHPQFFTTKLAKELSTDLNATLFPIQHHHAHSAALANDNDIENLIAICADGVGYGADGTSWGGEVLYTNVKSFKRMGSLAPQKMPGGDTSTKYPARMLESILYNKYTEEKLYELMIKNYENSFKYGKIEIKNVLAQLDSNINVSITTSTGRILDSVAVALGICDKRTYEGECSMKLESLANKGEGLLDISYNILKDNKRLILDTSDILYQVMDLLNKNESKKEIAYASQKAISEGLSEIAIKCADKTHVNNIGITGGVFYNEAITKISSNYIKNNSNYNFVQHKNSCPGDGSISLGQAVISSLR